MSLADKLFAQGCVKGSWIGKLQLLEEMMGLPVSSDEDLTDVEVAEIKRRFAELQRAYEEQFKKNR